MSIGPEWIVVLVVLLLLFGGKKLPDLARGVGRSLRIFKSETSGMMSQDEEKPSTVVHAQTVQPQPAPQPQPQLSPTAPAPSLEEQARRLEEEAARLRAAAQDKRA